MLLRLATPEAVQRFLDERVTYNHEPAGETLRSPRRVLRDRVAHCMEGALFAASAMRFHGRPPIVMQLRAVKDEDHVLALIREKRGRGAWGAVAKSKYTGLRFREPVYRSLRELVMSYFDQYFNGRREKTLRGYARPVLLTRFDRRSWQWAEEDLWDMGDFIATRRPSRLVTRTQVNRLRTVDVRLFTASRS